MTKTAKSLIIFILFLSFLFPRTVTAAEKISFMYLYGGTTEEYINQFQKAKGSVNIVSPNYFEIDQNGNLVINVDSNLTNYMHQQNVKVIPFLSNHWNRLNAQKALENPEKLATDLAIAVDLYNLDGINVDFENLTYNDRQNLTRFVSLLKEKLTPMNKTLSIAVGAVDKPVYSGWKSAYELNKLGQITDFIVVMAYDEHWRTSPPGPVASLPWVKSCLEYMLTQIPKEKLILGIPFYGRVWTNGANGGGILYPNIIKAVEENNATIKWHEDFKVPYVSYTKPDGSYKEIWFEDTRSLREKIRLVSLYNLKGVAAWRLGQEDTGIWNYYNSWLNGHYFTDTKGHWAENEILFLSSKDIVKGKDLFLFAPDSFVNRAEAVTILSRIFQWETIHGVNPFIDVGNNHWAKEPILQAYKNKVIVGISDNKFGPEEKLTRAQLAVILKRAFNLKYEGKFNYEFLDVPQNYWASKEIYILKKLGLIAGRSTDSFAPDSFVTRAELAAMVARIIR